MVIVAGAISDPGGLSEQPAEAGGLGPSGWVRDVQAQLTRLLTSDASTPADEAAPLDSSTSADSLDPVAAARLEGVRLTAREIAHLVNNDLTVAIGTLDLLRYRGDVPPHLQATLDKVLAGLSAATRHVEQLQHVKRVATRETPVGPSLDLERSL
jgi:hypothetical protein